MKALPSLPAVKDCFCTFSLLSDLNLSLAPFYSFIDAVGLHNHRAQNKHKMDLKSKLYFPVHSLPSFQTRLFSSPCLCSPPHPLGYMLLQFACRCKDTGFGSHQAHIKYSCIVHLPALGSKSYVNNMTKKKNQQQNIISPCLSIFSPFPKLLCKRGLRKVPLGFFRSSG